jgi:hypothetical protein
VAPEAHVSAGAKEHFHVRIRCIRKADRLLIPGSIASLHSAKEWEYYKQNHPELWCQPEDSYHTNALGQELDYRGQPVRGEAPPTAERITAEALLERIVAMNRGNPAWWKDPEKVKELAAIWGVRAKPSGTFAEYEAEEVVRLSPTYHASILLGRTGSGLFAVGIAARWGEGGTCLEPSVGSVPYDTETAARRAAFKELIAWLECRGKGDQQRRLLLAAAKEKDRDRGLFG